MKVIMISTGESGTCEKCGKESENLAPNGPNFEELCPSCSEEESVGTVRKEGQSEATDIEEEASESPTEEARESSEGEG